MFIVPKEFMFTGAKLALCAICAGLASLSG